MPLPKDIEKIEDWKRKIGFRELVSKQTPYFIENAGTVSSDVAKFEPTEINPVKKGIVPNDLTNKELIFYHGKMHVFYKERPHNWSKEDIVNLHTLIVKEMEKRNLTHKNYDDLDEVSKEFLSYESELIKNPKTYDPSKLDDRVLLDDHRIIHAWWSSLQEGKELRHADGARITKKEVREFHEQIAKELEQRGFKHSTPLEELLGNVEDRILNITDKLKDAVLIENFVTMVGSYTTEKEKPNDVDFLLRFDKSSPEFIERATKVRIAKMLDDVSEDFHFTGDPEGPHDDYVPIFDLVLKKRESELINLAGDKNIPPEKYFELEKKIVLGKAYLPQKPYGSATYEIKELLPKIKDIAYSVEKKLNGFHVTVHKEGNQVKIFSEQLKDMTVAFPTLAQAIKQLSDSNFVVDGELVPKTGGRRALAIFVGAVKRNKKADDREVRLYIWDITYYNEDIHNKTLEERKEILKKLHFSDRIINTPYIYVKGREKVLQAIKKMSELKESEGAVLKDISASYTFGEGSSNWFKHRKLADIHAVIIKQIPTKISGTYNYYFGIYIPENLVSRINPKYLIDFKNKKAMILGKTFNTQEKAKPGDIVDILIEELWRHRKDNLIRYSAHKPRFKMLRPDINKTSSLTDLDAIVVSVGIEVRE